METRGVRALAPAEITLAQRAWDMFLHSALQDFDDPNPDLRRDLALDRTIRALGQRPTHPPNREDYLAAAVRREIQDIFAEAGRIRSYGRKGGRKDHDD
jgi:hypothetical protein